MDTILEQLQKEEQALLARLTAIRSALAVYEGEAQPESSKPAEPDIPEYTVLAGAPTLDGLRIRDAINVYLRWCAENGRPKITLGELEDVLKANEVVSFHGQPISAMKYPFKTLTNILGSPGNQERWIVVMHSPERYQRADTIGLKAPKRASVEG